MLCHSGHFLFKFVSLLEIKRQLEKTSPTRETTNSILVWVLKWHHHANDLLMTSILLNTISKHNLSLGLHYVVLPIPINLSRKVVYQTQINQFANHYLSL